MKTLTLTEIAEAIGGTLDPVGRESAQELVVTGLAPLSEAGPDQLSWLVGTKQLGLFKTTRAGAVIIPADLDPPETANPQTAFIRAEKPEAGMARAAWLFVERPVHPTGVLVGAMVDPTARVAPDATVYPQAHVGPEAVLEAGVVVHPQVYIGARASLGRGTIVMPQAVILDGVRIGRECLIQPGAVIGGDGFGFAQDKEGHHLKIPQLGSVEIGDRVEVGANTAIDRATTGATVIGAGTKLDNLVQIGHNVVLGENCAFAGQVGIAGSCTVGRNCVMGGQVGLADHVSVGDGCMFAGQTGINNDVPAGQIMAGTPPMEIRRCFRVMGAYKKLPETVKKITALEKRIAELEARLTENED